MKTKSTHEWCIRLKQLGSPFLYLLCCTCFLAGLFASFLLPSHPDTAIARTRLLKSVGDQYNSMPFGETGDSYMTNIPFQILSWRPRAMYFPKFLSPQQCKSIIEMAEPKLRPSTLALRKGDTFESTQGIRTSYGVFISVSEDETGILGVVEEKIARATKFPRSHGEEFYLMRYEIGQKYDSHYDAFGAAEYGPRKSQRVATILLYLSDVEEGGETMFPFEHGLNMDGKYDFQKCIGLKVKPRQGDAVLFYSLFPNNTIDPTSLHGSCPVIAGEKWVATKWIRDQEQYDIGLLLGQAG